MIFISAGFDAHREDELGQLGLVEPDYTWITEQIKAVADKHAKRPHRVLASKAATTSGALARSVAAHLRVLTARMISCVVRPDGGAGPDGPAPEAVIQLARPSSSSTLGLS